MQNFNTSDYEKMIGDLIHDTFYVDLSNRGKIKGIRQFSEVLVRKILDIGNDKKLMLGQLEYKFSDELNQLQEERKSDLLEIISRILKLGNDSTHTQHIEEFSDDELNQVKDRLLDLYAFLFIEYFMKVPIDLLTPPYILRAFSFLPPIIRYKTLSYFYEKSPNIQVANRYLLSIIKVYGKESAREWLEAEKAKLRTISYPTDEEANEYYVKCGTATPQGIIVSILLWKYNDVYNLLNDKLNNENTSINERGKLYSDFEEAKSYYLSNKIDTDSEELRKYYDFTELNLLYELMDFVYLGREEFV